MTEERREIDPMLLHRIDQQDQMLLQIRDMIVEHIKAEAKTREAMDEIVLLWRGSKIIIPALAAFIGTLGALYMWVKEHIR